MSAERGYSGRSDWDRVWTRIAPLLCILVGCDDVDTAGWIGTVDTLEGGGIRVANSPVGTWSDGSPWRFGDVLQIGSIVDEGPDLFGMIRDVEVDEYGRIYVLDGHTTDIRVFDQTGRHVRTFGRPGEGPGELRNPSTLAWVPGGILAVVDARAGSYTLFDTTGVHVGNIRRDLPQNFYPWRGAIDDQGRIHDWVVGRVGDQVRQMLIRLEVDSATWTIVGRDTFYLSLPQIERLEMAIPGGVTSTDIPFGGELRWWIDSSRQAIWTTNKQDYRLTRLSLAGDTLLVVELDDDRVPVTPAERDDMIEQYAESDWRLTSEQVPDYKPAMQGFTVDSEGYLWVAPTLREGNAFDVFNVDGYYMGRVDVPLPILTDATRPLRITRDALLAVTRDSLNVEYVARLEIVKRR